MKFAQIFADELESTHELDRIELGEPMPGTDALPEEIQVFLPSEGKTVTFMCCREMQCCRKGCCN